VLVAYWSEYRVWELSGYILISGAVMLVTVPLLPATNAFSFYSPGHPEITVAPGLMFPDFVRLREGSPRVIDLHIAEGLVQLPSFHCIVTMLLAYTMREWRYLFPLAIVWSTPIVISKLSADAGHR
jgi:hypothetical protein